MSSLSTNKDKTLNHLTAKFYANQETFKYTPKKKGYLYLGSGVDLERWYISRSETKETDIYIPDEVRSQHFGCFGTTGCGKTTVEGYMATEDILLGRNVLIIDPKGDDVLLSRVVDATIKARRLEDFLYISPIYPDLSVKINMLHYHFIKDELVDHVVSGIRAKEEYFVNVAHEVTTTIINGLDILAKVRKKPLELNFFEIKRWCEYHALGQLQRDLEPYRGHVDPDIREEVEEVIMSIKQILSSPPDFFAKVSSSLRTVLTALSTSTTGRIIGKARGNEFIERLENGKGVILFCNTGSLLSRRTSHIIARVVISMVQACMGRMLSTGRYFDPPVCIYLDEGHNVLYYGIQELFNKGRAAGVWINFFTQSYSQIEKEIGPEGAKSIIDNISTWLYMRMNCEVSAKMVEEATKEVVVKTGIYSFEEGHFMPTLRETHKKMITADKLLKLPDRYFYLKVLNKEENKFTWYIGKIRNIEPPSVRVVLPKPEDIVVSSDEGLEEAA